MPLQDHFHPPLSVQRHWDGFHSKWASTIVDRLNEQLPERYFAEPHVHQGTQFEIDVATFEEESAVGGAEGGAATAVWSPAKPTVSLPLDFTGLDTFEVRVMHDEGGPTLVAAIELVSPGNKDRDSARRAFAVKCAAYLQQQVSLIVVDVVTSRTADLHAELCGVLQVHQDDEARDDLLTAAYRRRELAEESHLDVWLHALAVGDALPTLPLWLNAEDAVPVDLEESYATTCRTLRIDTE